MSLAEPGNRPSAHPPRQLLPYVVLLGVYLTLRGYHSFDGDQAYRFPLLLHQQDPALYADDPFVRSFDAFNPHRGYLEARSTSSPGHSGSHPPSSSSSS